METIVPDSLEGLSISELEALLAQLNTEFDAKYDDAENPAPLEVLAQIAAAVEQVTAAIDTAKAKADEDAAERERLREAMDASREPVTEPGDDTAGAADGDETDGDAPTSTDADADAPADAPQPEPVTAGATPARRAPSASGVTRRSAPVTPPPGDQSDVVITASADVPGFANGQTIDRVGVATAMHARARGLGDSAGKGSRFNVATVTTPIPSEFVIREGGNAHEIIEEAVRSTLEGKDAAALVAAGGWCAPSETLFDQFSVESRDGLLDIPTVGVNGGGTNVPSYFGIDAAASALWTWTEDQDEAALTQPAGPEKPCLRIPCPTWTDIRLEAEGLCLTHGNLMDRAYPQMTARFVDLTMTAHLHRLSNAKLAKIVASAVDVTVTTAPSDFAGDMLNAIDLQVADYRSQHLMGVNTVLDGIFPLWTVEAIRSTLAMRAGVESTNVTNAEVVAHFTNRNVRPQFIHGYDPLFRAATPAVAWPATTRFLLFAAGAYVAGDGGGIDLGVTRDSTLNATNDFTAAWSEQFYSIIQRGPAAREITVNVDVDGRTGGPEFAGAAVV